MKNVTLLLFSSFLLGACFRDNTPCLSPKPEIAKIYIVDKTTGESLIGIDKQIHPNDFTQLNIEDFGYAYCPNPQNINEEDSFFLFNYFNAKNGELYPFLLSQNDHDTISVEFQVREGVCGNYKELIHLYYNGVEYDVKSDLVTVKK